MPTIASSLEMKSLTNSSHENHDEERVLVLSEESSSTCSRLSRRCFLFGVIGMAVLCALTVVAILQTQDAAPPDGYVLTLFDSTKEALKDENTPQAMAYNWLTENYDPPTLASMEEWRKQQIFVLATIYYAFNGPAWKPENQAKWLDASISECEWTPPHTKEEDAMEWADLTPEEAKEMDREDLPIQCSKEGKIISLLLDGNVLDEDNLDGRLPPEIALLQSLEGLALPTSEAEDEEPIQLSELLPSEITQLSTLKSLSCQANYHLVGTIPSYLGQLSNNHDLTHLFLGYNALTGTIPTELGLLSDTALFFLDFSNNPLTGTIPSELGLITTLRHVGFNFITSLTGTVPLELCHPSGRDPPAIVVDCSAVACPEECSCTCMPPN